MERILYQCSCEHANRPKGVARAVSARETNGKAYGLRITDRGLLNPGDTMSRRTQVEPAPCARKLQWRFRARGLGSTHPITPDETNPPPGSFGRAGRAMLQRLGELLWRDRLDQVQVEPRRPRAGLVFG